MLYRKQHQGINTKEVKLAKWPLFAIPLFLVFIGVLGGIVTDIGVNTWYQSINLPIITPSAVIIGTVGIILYILIGISWLSFYRSSDRKEQDLHYIFGVNLFLNPLWSYIFFAWNQVGLALVEMTILNLTTIYLIFRLWQKHLLSASLLIPYFFWVSFASYLTLLIYQLN
ncbi:MAG: TspO/MBR family protein [Patescibacteria group bacterium]|nr:TspO/MBR family protein [Patescibacteria group bacterium]